MRPGMSSGSWWRSSRADHLEDRKQEARQVLAEFMDEPPN